MAVYPGGLPVVEAAGANLSSNPHSDLHDEMYAEIVALATELGTDPAGVSATVKARLNAMVNPYSGAHTSWTPTVSQPGAVTSTNLRARYMRAGRRVMGDANVSITGTGTTANLIKINVPVFMATMSANTIVGQAWILDSSTGFMWPCYLMYDTTSTCTFLRIDLAPGTAATYMGVGASAVALASGDVVSVKYDFEADADT